MNKQDTGNSQLETQFGRIVKVELLEEISKRAGKPISKIANKLEKTRGMVYQHLKELKDNGYVDEKFNITNAGRMALL